MNSFGNSIFDERPVIFFDSHPEPPAGMLWNAVSHVKGQLKTAWTGEVILDVKPGLLRLQWYTDEGKFGKKDYELREHDTVRQAFEELRDLPDVSRVMVVGYASQSPYSIYGESEYASQERKKREILESKQYRDLVPKAKKGPTVTEQINEIIAADDKAQEKKKQAAPVFGGETV